MIQSCQCLTPLAREVRRSELPGVRVELLVDQEPMFLKADITSVLSNIRRVLPEAEPVHVLITQPQVGMRTSSLFSHSLFSHLSLSQRFVTN